jgi:hypothetical protein
MTKGFFLFYLIIISLPAKGKREKFMTHIRPGKTLTNGISRPPFNLSWAFSILPVGWYGRDLDMVSAKKNKIKKE